MAAAAQVSLLFLYVTEAQPESQPHNQNSTTENSTPLRSTYISLQLSLTPPGNLKKDDPTKNYPKPEDLVTPTLKSNTYTTGRGGTGNMARNDPEHPELARAAQDVENTPQPTEVPGPKHYGRGGAANIISDGQPALRKSAEAKRKSEEAKAEEKGLLAKGKELLGKLGKK
jgi:hypothetical protein